MPLGAGGGDQSEGSRSFSDPEQGEYFPTLKKR